MRQRVHLITLGVDDLDRAAAFYAALGWASVAAAPPGLVVYDLWGASLALYPRAALARDVGRALTPGSGSMTLACNVRAPQEVDATVAAAREAGAEVLRPAFDADWGGRVAYVADPDGHLWEIAWNPCAPLGPQDQFRWAGHDDADVAQGGAAA